MRKIDVEVYDDPSRPGGGQAVILLRGLESVPARSVVRIRPLDSIPLAEVAGTRRDLDRLPLASRKTEFGVELLVGPDVVDNPQLLPGTATLVEVPAAEVRGEVLWPRLMPAARPRRRHLRAVRPERAVAEGEGPATAAEQARSVTAATGPDTGLVAGPGSTPRGGPEGGPGARPEVGPEVGPGAVVRAGAAGVFGAAPPATAIAAGDGAGHIGGAASVGAVVTAPGAVRQKTAPGSEAVAAGRETEPAASLPIAPTTDPSNTAAGVAEASAAALAFGPDSAGGRGNDAASKSSNGNVPSTEDATSAANPRRPRSKWSRRAAAAVGTLAAGAVAAALVAAGWIGGPTDLSRAAAAPQQHSLLDVLAPVAVSPAGARALAADRATALERADALLNPTVGRRNTAEAAYWLRQHLLTTLGDARTTWALTQLGSALAEPTEGRPDLPSARRLWEIAGAFGDPIALCFLGKMHELGLGVPPDRARALAAYRRAEAAGGCPDARAALTRLQR